MTRIISPLIVCLIVLFVKSNVSASDQSEFRNSINADYFASSYVNLETDKDSLQKHSISTDQPLKKGPKDKKRNLSIILLIFALLGLALLFFVMLFILAWGFAIGPLLIALCLLYLIVISGIGLSRRIRKTKRNSLTKSQKKILTWMTLIFGTLGIVGIILGLVQGWIF